MTGEFASSSCDDRLRPHSQTRTLNSPYPTKFFFFKFIYRRGKSEEFSPPYFINMTMRRATSPCAGLLLAMRSVLCRGRVRWGSRISLSSTGPQADRKPQNLWLIFKLFRWFSFRLTKNLVRLINRRVQETGTMRAKCKQ